MKRIMQPTATGSSSGKSTALLMVSWLLVSGSYVIVSAKITYLPAEMSGSLEEVGLRAYDGLVDVPFLTVTCDLEV